MRLREYCDRRWPNLSSLMTIYYGQDFIDDFGSPEGALRAIFYGTPDGEWAPLSKDELSAVLRELEEFMDFAREYLRKHPEKKEDFVLDMLGCAYNTYASGFTPMQWLEYLRNRIREHLERMQKQDAS
jgi:hypothetical protein